MGARSVINDKYCYVSVPAYNDKADKDIQLYIHIKAHASLGQNYTELNPDHKKRENF